MNEGDVILTPMPQADGNVKNRPAVILREMPLYGDMIVCGVSTQLHHREALKQRRINMVDLTQLQVQYVTNAAGEKTAVLLPIREFQELIEDLEDLAAVAERREEPTISHDELVAELKRDGLL